MSADERCRLTTARHGIFNVQKTSRRGAGLT
jgi:hypothetical protein